MSGTQDTFSRREDADCGRRPYNVVGFTREFVKWGLRMEGSQRAAARRVDSEAQQEAGLDSLPAAGEVRSSLHTMAASVMTSAW